MSSTLYNERYQLGQELGRGGMGVTYRARDLLLERDVAFKILSHASGEKARGRLFHEARAAARLNHPNVASVYDVGEQEGVPFIVMELVEGQTLHDAPPQDICGLIAVARQVCAALGHAHARNIIHLDLKPENVMVTPDGTAKLMDFGLAHSPASRVSSGGAITGTVFYLAPEQALGRDVDGRTDLYALGVMLYELAAGRLPFASDDALAVISQHLYAPPVPPRAHNPQIPPDLEALILQLLSKEPESRPRTAAEVGMALAAVRTEGTAGEPGPGEVSPLDLIARGQLIGRASELAELTAAWRRAVKGEGKVVLVSGEPGVGKTRLVRELIAQAQVTGGRVLLGECYAEGGTPYGPMGQMVRASLEQGFVRNGARIGAAVGAGGSAGDLPPAALADLLILAPYLAGRYPDVQPNPPLDPRAEQERLFESAVLWCTAMTAAAPLLLVLDDAHWADGATLALVRHLARRLRRARLLIVATYRETELGGTLPWEQVLVDLNRERLAERLKLGRLDREGTRGLLAALLQQEIRDEFLDRIYRETEGNPFFVEEVCKALIEEGKLYHAGGRWQRPDTTEIEIPQSVRMAVGARVSKLPGPVQDVLRTAAVLGREFEAEVLRMAGNFDEDTLIEALEAAERAQMIEENYGKGKIAFAFSHALTAAALYDGLSGIRRQRLHRRAAAALAAVYPDAYLELARHQERGGDAEAALANYVKAGDRALALFANGEAESAYRAGLELEAPSDQCAYLYAQLCVALDWQGRYEEAVAAGKSSIEEYEAIGNHDQAARVYATIIGCAWDLGDVGQAVRLGRAGLTALAGRGETPGLAYLLHATARALAFGGPAAEGEALCRDALALADRFNLADVRAEALVTLALFPSLCPSERQGALEEAVRLAQDQGLIGTAARARNNLGWLHRRMGHPRPAAGHYLAAAEIEHTLRRPASELFHMSLAAGILHELGEFRQAAALRERLRALAADAEKSSYAYLIYRTSEASWLNCHGDASAALEVYRDWWAWARQGGNVDAMLSAGLALANSLLERGQDAEAEAVLAETLPLDDRWLTGAQSRCLLALARCRQGRTDEARALLAAASECVRRQGYGEDEIWLARVEADIAAALGEWEEGLAACERLVGLLAAGEYRLRQAGALEEWAGHLVASGRAEASEWAGELLRQSLVEFEGMELAACVQRVRERIAAL